MPMMMHEETWGILCIVHFGTDAWILTVFNAPWAVASMLGQSQGRICLLYTSDAADE